MKFLCTSIFKILDHVLVYLCFWMTFSWVHIRNCNYFLSVFRILFHCLLAFIVLRELPVIILLLVIVSFLLAASNIFFFFLWVFCSFFVIAQLIYFVLFIMLRIHSAFWVWELSLLINLGKVSVIVFSIINFPPLLLFYSSGSLIYHYIRPSCDTFINISFILSISVIKHAIFRSVFQF